MTYNKSEIMTRAWGYFKSEKCRTFSQALKLSWKEAKTVETKKLCIGDTIQVEYGDYDNMMNCVVSNISSELFLDKYLVVNAISNNGLEVEFCKKPEDRIILVAMAEAMLLAA
jgi:hypothetical protein